MKELDKTYDPSNFEDRIYDFWVKNDYFKAKVDKTKKPFTIVIPPPNITGQLHMGHALDNTMQDILIRYKRMQGYSALWQPGTDHASIATEVKVVEKLKSEGIDKNEIGREEFLKHAWAWKEQYGNRIINQLKKLGSSCDWSRERFTMDEGCSRAVEEVFVNMYNKGLIYKGSKIINWCPVCHTSISDAEVEYEEQHGHFWHIKYPVVGEDGRYLEFATTRPETMLGDTAVAVHPDDERYKDLVGKTVKVPFVDREIPIIADEYVEKDFGTGVVKITPAHDPNDFEVGKRHNLPEINIMNDDATINENGGKFAGMDRYAARAEIVKELDEMGLLVRIEDYTHNVGTHDRCKTVIEPMIKKQWFVKMDDLIKPAAAAVRNKDIKLVPERLEKTYFNWTDNIRDWCISRQLWWGHRIPAYYCPECGEIVVCKSKDAPTVCPKCGHHGMTQDEDTLDTWFSSALWPFSTLGWPGKTPELDYFYPTSVLVTGYDIIFFWVIRMIFSGYENMGEKPFDSVLFHGLVRDSQGRKMSKSLGNGIDPLEVIDKYGADALRFTLITGNAPGNDMRFYWEKVEASRNFANKIWNAARFAMNYLSIDKIELPEKLEIEDKWILNELNATVKSVCENLDKFELGIAAQNLYDFIYDKLCDWYIELVKPRLFETNEDKETNLSAQNVLCFVLEKTLALLHPFMPFITEEIWQSLPHEGEALMISRYPEYSDALCFETDAKEMENVMSLIKEVRKTRKAMNVPGAKKTTLHIDTRNEKAYKDGEAFIKRLASAEKVIIGTVDPQGMVQVITPDANAYMPLGELIDKEKETARLEAEIAKIRSEIERVDKMLSNPGFVAKAPEAKINAEKEKREKNIKLLSETEKALEDIKNI